MTNTAQELNAQLPDGDRHYADARVGRAVSAAIEAARMNYDPQDPDARERCWRKALAWARPAAEQPEAGVPDAEVTFAAELALRAAMLAQEYGTAAEMLAIVKMRIEEGLTDRED